MTRALDIPTRAHATRPPNPFYPARIEERGPGDNARHDATTRSDANVIPLTLRANHAPGRHAICRPGSPYMLIALIFAESGNGPRAI